VYNDLVPWYTTGSGHETNPPLRRTSNTPFSSFGCMLVVNQQVFNTFAKQNSPIFVAIYTFQIHAIVHVCI
jgi:hypothetical protein